MKKIISQILILFLMVPLATFAQQKGKIAGVITDSESGDMLPGVNVMVEGTYYGASTDLDGYFIIENVNPGVYSIEIQYVGYKVLKQTGIEVEAGKTSNLEIQLEPTVLALGQEIVVIGEKPLFDIKETSSSKTISSSELANKAVENVKSLVAQQTGVVETDNEIHIRGSRTHEAGYLLDGISVQDPLAGTGFGLTLSKNAIEEVEVVTGGFRAEYGQATSGIVNVRTKSGGDIFKGSVSYKSDHFGFVADSPSSFNTDNVEVTFGGPEPFSRTILPAMGLNLPGEFTFFTNLYMFISDDYTKTSADQLYSSTFHGTTFAPRQNNSWSGLFKLTWNFNPVNKFILSYNKSISISQNSQSLQTKQSYEPPNPGFPYDYSKILDEYNTYTHNNDQVSLSWNHTLSPKSYFDLKLSRYFTNLRSDNGGDWTNYIRAQDVPRLPIEYFYPDSYQTRVIPGDGFYDGGNAGFWHDHWMDEWTLKGSITSHVIENHQLKAGFTAQFQEMQVIDIVQPYIDGGLGTAQDIYRVHPAMGSVYLQDDMTFSGMILNAGLRADYWFPGKLVDDAISSGRLSYLPPEITEGYKKETYDFFGRKAKIRISPRLGVSHPVSDNMMMFFNYGHFSKWPKPQFVYAKITPTAGKGAYQTYGNPNLNPETTVSYELGLRYKFSEDDVFNVMAYYKDIFDYIQTRSVNFTSLDATTGRTGSGIIYLNLDYARARGLEVEYKSRLNKNIHLTVGGAVSLVTTTSSNPFLAQELLRETVLERPVKDSYASWDRPWQFSTSLNYYRPKNDEWSVFGMKLPTDWNLNVFWQSMTGKRYTPAYLESYDPFTSRPLYYTSRDATDRYSEIGGVWSWVDMNFEKYFDITESVQLTFFVEVLNLFNFKNTNIVNPVTGEAYEWGDKVPADWNDPNYPDVSWPISDPYPLNPARYKNPRNIRAGFSVEF